MEGYALKAIESGVDVLCFTDHIECGKLNTFDEFKFEERQREFEQVKKQFDGQLILLNGFEISEPHLHVKELQFLRSLEPDMIIGSVHYPMDYQAEYQWVDRRTYEKFYNQMVNDMVHFGGFDVLGHMDLPKRYHDDYVEDWQILSDTLKTCAQKGIVPEINTSSLRKGCSETMVSIKSIDYYASCGGKYVITSSDSHTADTIGYALQNICDQLTTVTPCYFIKGKVVPVK